ncbi:uncharacterized protein CCOS01_08708 [Colletotrichum costaricense]|uniref:Uncharacterized protein n=1 Tax=Colletotrichum costaricense TaxID=1209916 RepID=A0AAI9YX18_9PEZI|nr:uncharacterized protein CCOS01_08708 [Colletotrichum costaricense]KAK1526290.1 hypothetical protein CCOS01_08708 [Colletotrichum costaricense]
MAASIMVVPIIGPGSGRPIPQDAATELPLSIFFPDCYIPPFGMQAHEGWRIRHPWSQFVYKSQSLAIERYAVSVLFAETFALAVRRVDLRQIGTVCTIGRMPVLGCLPSEPEIAAVNASCTGFRRCLQLCVGTEGQCAGILSDMRGGLLEGPWNSSVWVLHCIGRSHFSSSLSSFQGHVRGHHHRDESGASSKRREGKTKHGLSPSWIAIHRVSRLAGLWRFGGGGGLLPLFENGKSADVSEVDLLVLISPRPKSLTLPANWVQ